MKKLIKVIGILAFLFGGIYNEGSCETKIEGVGTIQIPLPLVEFSAAESRSGWLANPWGGGSIKVRFVDEGGREFPSTLLVTYKDTAATLSNSSLFAKLSEKWKEAPFTGFYISCRADMSEGNIYFQYVTDDGLIYVNELGIRRDNAWQTINVGLGGWNREEKFLEREKLKEIHIEIRGTGTFEIGEIGVISTCRPLEGILKTPLKQVHVFKTSAIPEIDGEIKDKEWETAARIELTLPDEEDRRYCGNRPPSEKTDVFIKAGKEGLYLAARCFKNDISKLKAGYTENSERVCDDECMEFYFDPGRRMSGGNLKKFAINANAKTGMENPEDRRSAFDVAAGKYDNRWEMEIFLPWQTLGLEHEKTPFATGFNVTRTAYEDGNMAERSGWTTPVWNAVKDFGILLAEEKQGDKKPEAGIDKEFFGRVHKGEYLLSGKMTGSGGYKFRLYSPDGKKELASSEGKISEKFNIPVIFAPKTTALYPFSILFHNPAGKAIKYLEGEIPEENVSNFKALGIDDIALFPEPKILKLEEKSVKLAPEIKCFIADEKLLHCLERLNSELNAFYGRKVIRIDSAEQADVVIDLGLKTPGAVAVMEAKFPLKDYDRIKEDGFLLIISENKILISAKEKRGALYGTEALMDLVKMTTGDSQSPSVRLASVLDWPDASMRFAHHWVGPFYHANKIEVPFFKEILNKTLLHNRYNGIFFQLDNFYHWKCAPKMRVPQAWTESDFREVVKFVNSNYIPAMPLVQSLGHMNWWLIGYNYGFDYLGEDGKTEAICTRHPDTYKVLFSFYDELIRLCSENPEYKPKYFNTSLDEVRWETASVPEEKLCKLCKGIPKKKIFVEHIKKLDEYIKSKGLSMIMFSDMISEAHNGLNEFQCATIRDEIPRDVLLAHWAIKDYPEIEVFHKMGFKNLKFSTGYQVNRLNEKYVEGYNLNLTTYNWWLTWTRNPYSHSMYAPMAIALFGNSCWNIFPDDDNSTWMKYARIYGNWLVRNWSRKPLPPSNGKFSAIDLSGAVNDIVNDKVSGDGTGWFDLGPEYDISAMDFNVSTINGIPVSFAKKDRETSFIKFPKLLKNSAKLNINKKVSSLIILHAANLDEKDRGDDKFRSNYHDWLTGLPIAKYTLTYDDGKTEIFEALFGWNISHWQYNPVNIAEVFAKYVMDTRSLIEGKTKGASAKNLPEDTVLYQYEWMNPRPEAPIKSIKIEGLGTYVSYGVLAITAREAL